MQRHTNTYYCSPGSPTFKGDASLFSAVTMHRTHTHSTTKHLVQACTLESELPLQNTVSLPPHPPAPHRVTFASGTVLDPEPVHLDPEPDDDMCGLPEAHIGLLLNHHTYKADIPVKHSLGLDVTAENPTYNLYIRVMALSETQEMDMADMDGDR